MQHSITYLVLVLSILIFVASGETAWKLEAAEQTGLTYMIMCLLSFCGLATSFYCFLSLTHDAKKEIEKKRVMDA